MDGPHHDHRLIMLVMSILLMGMIHSVSGSSSDPHPHDSDSNKVILLDTTKETSLDWTRYPYGPQSRTPGWVEESFTNFEQGINWRSYVTCDVAYNNVNNWLWTPLIERKDANRIYIEVKFSMRDCSLFPGMALSCKETFSLLYYEYDDISLRDPPPWDPESYKLIDRIAADAGRFTSNSEVIINTEIRSIPVTKKGVYFAFRDQGACLSLISIRVYTLGCPSLTHNFAHFSTTPTGSEVTSIVPKEGSCVPNSVMNESPKMLCKGDGNWTLPSGGCRCIPGYEPNVRHQAGPRSECSMCPAGTFKPLAGDEPCGPCPAHSRALYRGSTECRCDPGYYRADKDPKWSPCTQPPSSPQNLTSTPVDGSSVKLSWFPPKFLGSRNDTMYRITCDSCGPAVQFTPSSVGLNETSALVFGLSGRSTYRFQVYAENGVSPQIVDSSQFMDITVRTPDSFSVSNLKLVWSKPTEVQLSWDPIDDGFQPDILMYEVKYARRGHERNATTLLTHETKILIPHLKDKSDYAFQVRCKTTNGWTDYSKAVYRQSGGIVGKRDAVKEYGLIAGVTAAIIALLGVIILMVIVYLKRGADECSKKQPSDCDTLEYTRTGEVVSSMEHPPLVPTARFNTHYAKSTPIFTHYSASPSYGNADSHTYEDPNQILPLTAIKSSQCISYGNTYQEHVPCDFTMHDYNTNNISSSARTLGHHPLSHGHHHPLGSSMGQSQHGLHHQQQQQQQQLPLQPQHHHQLHHTTFHRNTMHGRKTDL